MTISDWAKALDQLKGKPAKIQKYIKHNKPKPRATGYTTVKCRRCGRSIGMINKYRLMLCRTCFREVAERLGFRIYR